MLVMIDILAIRMADLTKSIHIQLSDERGEISMLEIPREDLLGKFADVFDVKRIVG